MAPGLNGHGRMGTETTGENFLGSPTAGSFLHVSTFNSYGNPLKQVVIPMYATYGQTETPEVRASSTACSQTREAGHPGGGRSAGPAAGQEPHRVPAPWL